MHQSKSDTPVDPDEKQYAWHRHPAFITILSTACTVAGGILTVLLGQADVLPAAINPAPPPTTVLSTTTATATTTSTVTETVTETPVAQITDPGSSSTPQTLAPGTLAITIQMGSSGKIGPGEYRAASQPTTRAQVLDETGHYPSTGCYPTWVLKRGSVVIKTARGESCGESFYFTRDLLEIRGVYHLTVSVVTEAGAKGTKTEDFKVS
ncbi:hypothetical protein ACWF0M_29635 [Kribbella sp. NPDC055110]